MINLFEYQNRESFSGNYEGVEEFLDEIWKRRERANFYDSKDSEKIEVQRFVQFLHKTKEVKSNKYVGVVHFEGQRINLLPKIFYQSNRKYDENQVNIINQHILWYFSYCRKIKFPNYLSSLGSVKNDFFEILIYLFAKYTRELLTNSIYQQYEEVSAELNNIRGRINTSAYITENISKAKWHKLSCSYDAFVMDNKFNRIIKNVCTLLMSTSTNSENKKYLREILFILDEVSDESASANDCEAISFNPMFKVFETVLDYCKLFLSNSISVSYKNYLKLFAFLVPMEYLFEDFTFGFIEKKLSEVDVKSQSSSVHLDEDKSFGLKPDLYISTPKGSVIADTKYKIIYSDESDPKKGIAQADLYQMIAYAIRFKIQKIFLLYPNNISFQKEVLTNIKIKDKLAEDKEIDISAHQLPIINFELFKSSANASTTSLSELFELQEKLLVQKLKEIFL